jgi:ribosome-binding protein aMBF1 (putative translation factor)
MLTPEQLRAARALVGWSREDLARKSATSAETVKGFEGRGTDPKMGTVLKWKRALEAAGVIFIDPDTASDEGGAGVRMRSQKRR